jgi:hypothetical protein
MIRGGTAEVLSGMPLPFKCEGALGSKARPYVDRAVGVLCLFAAEDDGSGFTIDSSVIRGFEFNRRIVCAEYDLCSL